MPVWFTAVEAAARWPAQRISLATGGDQAKVTAAIVRAESRAKSELVALRYAPSELPSTPETTNEALKRVVGGLFWHYLHEGLELRGDDVRDVYRDALAELKAMGTGHMSLLLAGDPATDNSRQQILMERREGACGSMMDTLLVDGSGCRPTFDGGWDGFD